MNRGYIRIDPFNLTCPYAINIDGHISNGNVNINDIAQFCASNKIEALTLYGVESYSEGVKKDIEKQLASKYNYKNCKILIEGV